MSRWMAKTEFNTWTGQWLRRMRRRQNELCINLITYHSIAAEDTVLTRGTALRHDPAEFERQIDYLAENYRPVSLRQVVDALEQGEHLHKAVAVTFDGGLADSLCHAMPILVRRRIPMTVFTATSVIDNTDLLWHHKLRWLVQQGLGAKVCEALTVEGFGAPRDDQGIEEFARQNYRADLPEILEALVEATGTTGAALAGKIRPYMEPEEMAQVDAELVEFGNQSHTHAVLSALDEEGQRGELLQARDVLRSIVGYEPLALAYPFGLKRHYNADSRRLGRETGHRAALDARGRINRPAADPFELSRKPAPCGSQRDFEQTIEDWPDNALL